MTKIDIFSGFLGAGKTTLIKKLIKEAYAGERVVLIENEFGEIGVDGGFLEDAGIEITEMNSGCICCSLVGDFTAALKKVIAEYNPDRVVIEPSGVGKLSDVLRAVVAAAEEGAVINCTAAVADVKKCKMYMKNFGEFYNDQIATARAILFSHADTATEARINESIALVRSLNPDAVIITTPLEQLDGKDILSAIENKETLAEELERLEHEHRHHHHHHEDGEECHCHEHHHEDGEECHCHEHHHEHHHEDGEECHCHEHHHEHHHEDGEECHCHEHNHEHHHEDGEECHCGCGGHHGHHHHHADDVFTSFGTETVKKFGRDELGAILDTLSEDGSLGTVLRAKGIVECAEGGWLHFDYVPGEADIRIGGAAVMGRLCVIGSGIDKEKIKELFGV